MLEKRLPENLWNCIKNLFPKNNFGRPSRNPKTMLEGILYVIDTGIPWRFLPPSYGPPSTVHGTFIRWCKLGIFDQIMSLARNFYLEHTEVPRWIACDTSMRKAPLANFSGRNPTDRGKMGVKLVVASDWYGAPMAVTIEPANKHDSQTFKELFESLPDFIKSPKDPWIIAADGAYDAIELKKFSAKHNHALLAATNRRRNQFITIYQPQHRYIVETSFSRVFRKRGLKICWTKYKNSFLALVKLTAAFNLFQRTGLFGQALN